MAPTPYPAVTVALVSYNSARQIAACLSALAAQTIPHQVIVVDNASTDNSASIAAGFTGTRVIPLRRNVGFGRGVNIAAREIDDSDGILITLNPDVVPRPDFIEQIVAPFDDPSIASAAGTLVFASDQDVVASAGVRVFRNGVAVDARLGERFKTVGPTAEVFGASGGAAAYRVTAFRHAGGFCGAFFLYLEDVDLAWRLRLLGWRSMWVPGAVASHVYSASAGEGSAFKRCLLARNRIWTLARCLPSALWRRHRWEIIRFDIRAAGWGLLHRDSALLAGRTHGIVGLPARLCERRVIQAAATVPASAIAPWIEPSPPDTELLRMRALTARLAGRTID